MKRITVELTEPQARELERWANRQRRAWTIFGARWGLVLGRALKKLEKALRG